MKNVNFYVFRSDSRFVLFVDDPQYSLAVYQTIEGLAERARSTAENVRANSEANIWTHTVPPAPGGWMTDDVHPRHFFPLENHEKSRFWRVFSETKVAKAS